MTHPGRRGLALEPLGLVALLVFVLISTIAAWTPSHYDQAANILGMEHAGPVFGGSRSARSDEWGVTTAYYQIAVASDLGARDVISPYHEPLKTFFALPSRDWSMAFKPDLWGFLVLDPARAFALHYALLAAAALLGGYLLLRQLGCRKEVAAATAAILFFSQFVQVWWTSNAPVLGLATWPAVIYLWRKPWWVRAPVLAYVIAVWLIGELYPPFIVASGLALAVAIASFRPDALKPRQLAVGLGGLAAGLAIAWLHYADLIPIMAATVYPGRRISDGGGVHLLQLAAHVFPYLLTRTFEPIELWVTNASEIGVVGSFLPLTVLFFCDYRALAPWAAQQRRSLYIWAAGLLVMAGWMVLPIPGYLAPGLNLVPGGRLLWGFGLLLLVGLAVIISHAKWRFTPLRVLGFSFTIAASWAASKLWLADGQLLRHQFDWRILPLLLGLIVLHRLVPQLVTLRRVILGAVCLCSLLTFGRYNPIQPAGPIFSPTKSAGIESLRAYAQANPKGMVVALGEYSATLNGLGVPSVNHTLVRPEPAFFRAAYPDLDDGAFANLFNRYEHVMPALVWAPTLVQGDVVAIPPDPFAIPLPVDVAPGAPGALPPVAGRLDQAEATPLEGGRWGLMIGGWSDWKGVTPDQRLTVMLAPGAGRIVSATAFRLPRPELAQAWGDTMAFAAGFGLRLVIETPDGARPAGKDLRLIASDGKAAWALPQRAVKPAGKVSVVWPKIGRAP